MFSVRAENLEFKAVLSEFFEHFSAVFAVGISLYLRKEIILPEGRAERSAFYHLHIEPEFSDDVYCFRESSRFVLYDEDKSEQPVVCVGMSLS